MAGGKYLSMKVLLQSGHNSHYETVYSNELKVIVKMEHTNSGISTYNNIYNKIWYEILLVQKSVGENYQHSWQLLAILIAKIPTKIACRLPDKSVNREM
jgi:hypothetical protein